LSYLLTSEQDVLLKSVKQGIPSHPSHKLHGGGLETTTSTKHHTSSPHFLHHSNTKHQDQASLSFKQQQQLQQQRIRLKQHQLQQQQQQHQQQQLQLNQQQQQQLQLNQQQQQQQQQLQQREIHHQEYLHNK